MHIPTIKLTNDAYSISKQAFFLRRNASLEVGPGELREQIQCIPFFYMLLLVRLPSFSVNKVRGRKRCIAQSCWVKHPSPRCALYKERTHAKTPTMQVAPTGWMVSWDPWQGIMHPFLNIHSYNS